MRDEDLRRAEETSQASAATPVEGAPVMLQEPEPATEAPPITSRFLFVSVAGQRAKQLRRGASPRLDDEEFEQVGSSKAERLAMAEVRRGLVHWELPEWQRRPRT